MARFDAVVLLHSVWTNTCHLDGPLRKAVCLLPQPKALFLGNEYKLLPDKMTFCEMLGVSLLVTMNPSPRARQLYRDRLGCRVVCIPSSGLDTAVFRPIQPRVERPIDLGCRAFRNPLFLGHDERYVLVEFFRRNSKKFGLTTDLSLDPEDRFSEGDWAGFLNRCKGQIGSEAGGDYFELTDETRLKVSAYLNLHPQLGLDDVFEMFFKNYPDPVPCRTISGRHVEAAGTKTVQILFNGHYNGFLKPDEHYIPLEKDFSNADEAIAKFRDEAYCDRVTQNAYDLVRQELTYDKLIERFYEALRQVL